MWTKADPSGATAVDFFLRKLFGRRHQSVYILGHRVPQTTCHHPLLWWKRREEGKSVCADESFPIFRINWSLHRAGSICSSCSHCDHRCTQLTVFLFDGDGQEGDEGRDAQHGGGHSHPEEELQALQPRPPVVAQVHDVCHQSPQRQNPWGTEHTNQRNFVLLLYDPHRCFIHFVHPAPRHWIQGELGKSDSVSENCKINFVFYRSGSVFAVSLPSVTLQKCQSDDTACYKHTVHMVIQWHSMREAVESCILNSSFEIDIKLYGLIFHVCIDCFLFCFSWPQCQHFVSAACCKLPSTVQRGYRGTWALGSKRFWHHQRLFWQENPVPQVNTMTVTDRLLSVCVQHHTRIQVSQLYNLLLGTLCWPEAITTRKGRRSKFTAADTLSRNLRALALDAKLSGALFVVI